MDDLSLSSNKTVLICHPPSLLPIYLIELVASLILIVIFLTAVGVMPAPLTVADNGHAIIAANIALASVALVAVVLRLLARHVSRTPLKSDDFLIIGALVSNITIGRKIE